MSLLTKDSCILITSGRQERSKKMALAFHQKMVDNGYQAYIDIYLAEMKGKPELACTDQEPNIIFVFGGDGTILKTYATWQNAPIFGINCGRVGFLTTIEPDEIDQALSRLENGEYFIEEYSTIEVKSKQENPVSAANDVIVTSNQAGQTLSLRIDVDGEYLYSMDGDGLIVATSTGSSAYNLSAGGSLISPKVEAVTIVPICPFYRHVIPMVFSLDSTIKVTNMSKHRDGGVVIDGLSLYSIKHGESIEITKSNDKIKFIRFTDNYITRVREKLLPFNPDDFNEK